MKYKIVVDSSSDLESDYLKGTGIGFAVAPLVLSVEGKDYVDDEKLNIPAMLEAMHKSKQKSTSSCPSPDAFLHETEEAEYTFIVTISSKLSGAYNSACVAQSMSAHPERITVLDSRATGGVMALIVDELVRLMQAGKEYEDIVTEIHAYIKTTNLFFILKDFDNLVKNGRMNKLVSIVTSMLKIRPLCEAKDGEIAICAKIRTLRASIEKMVQEIALRVKHPEGRTCIVSACQNEALAHDVRALILAQIPFREVRVTPMRGLCSFYALEDGIIVSY